MSHNYLVIYGQPNCPGCDAVKKWLDQRSVPYSYIDLAVGDNKSKFLTAHPQARSVPFVLLNGIHLKNGIKDLEDSVLW